MSDHSLTDAHPQRLCGEASTDARGGFTGARGAYIRAALGTASNPSRASQKAAQRPRASVEASPHMRCAKRAGGPCHNSWR